ncbi:maleylpyruvate isomerase N-terminal domain-containing protein [Nocardia sp. R6R-6]|uniref:maleylpyruvate isomerase N-terminal domain-containing protein n=1 Tax=Nocardia sp. R6R-6 TaxID=3459303 RepID=UPI00403D9196
MSEISITGTTKLMSSTARRDAFRIERADFLSFCRELDEGEWSIASKAEGWRVRDVVAHLGAVCHSLFDPGAMLVLRGRDIEEANDIFVERRRTWSTARIVAEYQRWSGRSLTLGRIIGRSPLASVGMPLAGLGRFPFLMALTSAMVFDHHTHLRHDIAPALDRPIPSSDANRMALVLEWMTAVLGNQLRIASPTWLDRPIALELDGPGGGKWLVSPANDGETATAATAATTIRAVAAEFPEWATRRARWADRNVAIAGDVEYGRQFLDSMNVV